MVKLKKYVLNKCKWKHHAPGNFLKFHWLFGKKILTKVKKKRSNKLHLKDLLYEFIILLKQFEPGSPPIAKCRKRRLPTFMVPLFTARNDIWKSKKSNLFGGKKHPEPTWSLFNNMPFKRNIERKKTTQNATLIWYQICFGCLKYVLSRWLVSKDFIMKFHPPTFRKRSNVTNLYIFFQEIWKCQWLGGSSQSVVVVTPIPYSQTMDFGHLKNGCLKTPTQHVMKPCKIMGYFYHISTGFFSPDFLLPSTVLGCPAGTQ